MALLIGFDSRTKLALAQLETWPDLPPDQTAFWLPDEARSGDRVLWYIGGTLKSFVAIGRTTSDWRSGRAGDWKGIPRIGTSVPRRLAPFVSGVSVAQAVGLPVPRGSAVVPRHLEKKVLAFLRGGPVDGSDRAIEGAATESRSRRRSASLREKARLRANGVCEACGTNFSAVAGGLGGHCLVVHHKKQIRDYDQPYETSLDELAIVCANCHMIIHSNSAKALTLAQVRAKLGVTVR